ncbi:HNH endonuclease signature motif containing protein, partial [Pseudokineococcus basanitobsidens]
STDAPASTGARGDATTAATRAGAGAATAGGSHPGRCHGPQVVVAMTSLLGLDDEPAQLAGHGPVPAAHLAAHLRHHPYWRAFTDPATGTLLALDGHLLHPTGTPDPTPRPVHALPLLLDHLGLTTGAPGGSEEPGATVSAPQDPTSRRPPTAALAEPAGPAGPTTPGPAGSSASTRDRDPERDRRPGEPARPRPECPVTTAGGGPYTPTTALQRFLRARQSTCTHPGCRVPATRCDLDHTHPHATGGPTCPCNLHPLCRRHHLAKHHHGWTPRPATTDPHDTRTTWTSPLGQTTTTHPEPLLPAPTTDTPRPSSSSGSPGSPGSDDEPRYPDHDTAATDTTWTRQTTARHETQPDTPHRPHVHDQRPHPDKQDPTDDQDDQPPDSWRDDRPPPF